MTIFLSVGDGNESAFHDAGVNALIIEQVVAAAADIGDDAAVGQETCREEHDAVLAKEGSQLVLQLNVDVKRTVEERRTGTSGSVLVDGALGGLLQTRVVGKAKIGVAAEHQDRVVIASDIDLGVLWAANGCEVRINTQGSHLLGIGVLS